MEIAGEHTGKTGGQSEVGDGIERYLANVQQQPRVEPAVSTLQLNEEEERMKHIIAGCIGCTMFVGLVVNGQAAQTKCTVSTVKGSVVVMDCKKDMKLKVGNRVVLKTRAKALPTDQGC